MKGLALFIVCLPFSPIGLVNPFFGMMYYNLFALIKPEWVFYGFPKFPSIPWIIGGATFLGWICSREPKLPTFDSTTWLVIALIVWGGITTFFALDSNISVTKYNLMIKIYIFALVMYCMLTTTWRIQVAFWVLGLSIAAWGTKGGLNAFITGGKRVYGPDHSVISDNNDFAIVLATVLPLLVVLRGMCTEQWKRHGISLIIGFNVICLIQHGFLVALLHQIVDST